jgi:flavin-binding protein dodecin
MAEAATYRIVELAETSTESIADALRSGRGSAS